MPSTTAAIIMTVVAAGVSAYGMYQSGKSQEAISNYNAQNREREAEMRLLAMRTQAAQQQQQAEANFKLRKIESDARMNNAKSMEGQALAQDAVDRLNLRKRREDFARMVGKQRADIAASGVSESSGTPLDLLAETQAKIRQDQNEQKYVQDVRRRTLFNEAAVERLGGKLALAGATLDRDSSVAAAALNEASAQGEYLSGMREAEITRLTGSAARTSANYQAAGTLLSGLSGAGDMYFKYNPPKTKAPTSAGQV